MCPSRSTEWSTTKRQPFQRTMTSAWVIDGEVMSSLSDLAKSPRYGEPFRWTWMPTPPMASKPGKPASPMSLRIGAVTVICTWTGNAPAGTTILTRRPSTRTGPIFPPAGPIVTLVTTVGEATGNRRYRGRRGAVAAGRPGPAGPGQEQG